MKKRILAFACFCISSCAVAQNTPSFRQFYFNPFTFNPAYTGIDGYTDVYLATRIQWLNFKDAPTSSSFGIQYPTKGRVSLGLNFFSQNVVALKNNSAFTTVAYRIPIAERKSIIFGLSAGVGNNSLDLGNADYSNDPTILNAAASSFYLDGNFGVLYEAKNLRVGFALPKLFAQKYFSPQQLGSNRFAQLLNQNYSVSYKFFVSRSFIEPWLLCRLNENLASNWELGLRYTIRDRVWLGTSYNTTLGNAFFIGFDVKEKFQLGYSFELPPIGFPSSASHEFQFRLRFGSKREFRWEKKFY